MSTESLCPRCDTPARDTAFCTQCGTSLLAPVSEEGDTPVPPVSPPIAVVGGETEPHGEPEPATSTQLQSRSLLAPLVVTALVLSGWAMWRGVEEHTLSGTMLVTDTEYFDLEPGDSCTGLDGYDDVAGGAQVVVVDGRGATLSTGRLAEGRFDGLGCAFSFALEDVGRSDFYGLTVGGGSRGELQYSYDELAADKWSVQLSLGDF